MERVVLVNPKVQRISKSPTDNQKFPGRPYIAHQPRPQHPASTTPPFPSACPFTLPWTMNASVSTAPKTTATLFENPLEYIDTGRLHC